MKVVRRIDNHNLLIIINKMVGMARIELTTPASRRQCSTRLSYTPTRRYLIKFLNQLRERNL